MVDRQTATREKSQDALVALLRTLHEQKESAPSTAQPPTARSLPHDGSSYDRARAHFAAHEQRLRHEDAISERLIEQLRADASSAQVVDDPAPAPQQLLKLIATEGGDAKGRFVLSNDGSIPVSVRLVASTISSTEGQTTSETSVQFEPPEPILLPNDAQTIQLTVLGPDEAAHDQRVELRVDAWSGTRIMLTVWVEVSTVTADVDD